jgi:hypothetical protein
MPSVGVREVRRGAVSIRMLYAERAVELDCVRHAIARVIALDAAAFGRELVNFFNDHEDCSAGEAGVVVDVSIANPRVPVE